MRTYQITEWCQEIFRSQVAEGGTYVDATVGNGHDTLFLCRMAGESGRVFGFDIQNLALEHTGELLKEHGVEHRAVLFLESHSRMDDHIEEESVDGICFNFGYLPGGDHKMATRSQSSLEGITQGLKLLKKGGMMSLCIYSGGDTGFEERDAILEYLRELDRKRYVVILNAYYNRENHPPIPVFVFKK